MATVDSKTYEAQKAGKIALDSGVEHSTILISSTEFEATALTAGSTINLFELPINAKIHNFLVAHDALGGGTALDIGDSNDTDRYVDGLTTTSAGSTTGVLPDGAGYTIGTNAGDNVVTATTTGTATGTIKVACFYAL